MTKFSKILILSVLALILVIGAFFLFDHFVYISNFKKSDFCQTTEYCRKKYAWSNPYVYGSFFYNYGKKDDNDIKAENSILLLGGAAANTTVNASGASFAKLYSKYTHRHVIDRSLAGGCVSNAYFLSTNEEFYNTMRPVNEVIYILENQDAEILYSPTARLIPGEAFNLHYYVKNNQIKMSNYNNYLLNFIRSLYTSKLLADNYVKNYITNYSHVDKITNDQVLFLKEAKKNMEEHWNNKIKFTVLIYGPILYQDELTEKLIDEGFNVIDMDSLTDEEIHSSKYMQYGVPNEQLWNLLIPLIASEISK